MNSYTEILNRIPTVTVTFSKDAVLNYPLNLICALFGYCGTIQLPADYAVAVEYVLHNLETDHPQEAEILRMRYQKGLSLRAIGEFYGFSHERVR